MKRLLKALLLFVPIAITFYMLMLWLFVEYVPGSWRTNVWFVHGQNGHTYTKLREADTVKNVDILVLGTSHAYMGYDPRIFAKNGYKLFNLGTPLQSMNTTLYLCEKYLDKINPKFIVFDIYPHSFSGKTFESTVDIISNDIMDKKLIAFAAGLKDVKSANTLAYSLARNTLHLDDNFKEPVNQGYEKYIMRGYEETYHRYNGDSIYNAYSYKIDSKQLRAFEKIIEIIRQRKIPYLLYQSPILKQKYKACTNNAFIDNLLNNSGRYVNFNAILSIPDSAMTDFEHLNQKGVNIYNAAVIKSLIKEPMFLNTIN